MIFVFLIAYPEGLITLGLVCIGFWDMLAACLFGLTPLSPFGVLGTFLTRDVPPLWMPAQPKRFAWFLGVLMTTACIICNRLEQRWANVGLAVGCIILTWLEAALGFCLGCWMWNHGVARLLGKEECVECKLVIVDNVDMEHSPKEIHSVVEQHPVVVFSTGRCPYCVRAKAVLTMMGAAFHEVNLDDAEHQGLGASLYNLTGQDTVPNIWIGAKFIGGCDDLLALQQEGTLKDRLEDAGAFAGQAVRQGSALGRLMRLMGGQPEDLGHLDELKMDIESVMPKSSAWRSATPVAGDWMEMFTEKVQEVIPVTSYQQRQIEDLMEDCSRATLGYGHVIQTPFGAKQLLYADFTASGRFLKPIEHFLQNEVMPLYGNTHSRMSQTGLQSTNLREEARHIIAKCLNADIDNHSNRGDSLIFTGSGCTAAINKLVSLLNLSAAIGSGKRCVVFISIFEHHSNLLPWREVSGLEVVTIPASSGGQLDMIALNAKLREYQHFDVKIGSFSAASNITGVLTPTQTVTRLLHQYGALAFWDYAAAAPHVRIDMNPAEDPQFAKDALFFSPHKLLGAPSTPGILVVKNWILNGAKAPSQPGGGTVAFVDSKSHEYLSNGIEREEAGTPAILGAIRAGCAFHIRSLIGEATMEIADAQLARQLWNGLSSIPNMTVLGPDISSAPRTPVFAFLVSVPWDNNKYLHHSFVAAVLNDLYGIQLRGGCMCAGPYSISLLGMPSSMVKEFAAELGDHRKEYLKPGFTRLSLPFCASPDEVEYTLEAIRVVATYGWSLLPLYTMQPNGEWRHVSIIGNAPSKSITEMSWPHSSGAEIAIPSKEEYRNNMIRQISEAKGVIAYAMDHCRSVNFSSMRPSLERLLWFAEPIDAVQYSQKYPVAPSNQVLNPGARTTSPSHPRHTTPDPQRNFSGGPTDYPRRPSPSVSRYQSCITCS